MSTMHATYCLDASSSLFENILSIKNKSLADIGGKEIKQTRTESNVKLGILLLLTLTLVF